MKTDEIMDRILRDAPSDLTITDIERFKCDVATRIKQGWEAVDIVRFFRSTEEINPELSEAVALERMQKITDKYNL